jgi:hypothetical protein
MSYMAFAGVFCVNEFLGGDRVTTKHTQFFPTQSGPAVDVTAGVNARITDSIYMFGQYEYENADKIPNTLDGQRRATVAMVTGRPRMIPNLPPTPALTREELRRIVRKRRPDVEFCSRRSPSAWLPFQCRLAGVDCLVYVY